MKKTQFDQLVIQDFEEERFHLPVHGQTYYEIIYIRKGSGIHLLNNKQILYNTGDIFIVSPEDEHHFDIHQSTHFTLIKFTDSYFSGYRIETPDGMGNTTTELIMGSKHLKEVKVGLHEPCRTILRNTMENLVAYNCRKDVATSPLVYYQVLSIFGLLREAAAKRNIRVERGQPDRQELISYIHQNIYSPEKTQIKNIAAYFNISTSYFSDYFKRNFGTGYKSYIDTYRITLIEKRLQIHAIPMKQIAGEFGFTDQSHMYHFFKKMRNMSPQKFRDTNTGFVDYITSVVERDAKMTDTISVGQ